MADEILPQTLYETPEPEQEPTEAEERGSLTEDMLRRILDDNRQANADLIRQVTTPRGQPLQRDSVNPELDFTLEGLPDPAMDPAGFHKGYMARFREVAQKFGKQVEQRASQKVEAQLSHKELISQTDAMIKAANPNLDDEIIGFASGVIANRLRAQGKDPSTELRANMEGVAQDILDYTDEMVQKLGGRGRVAEQAPTNGRTRGLVQPRARTPNPPRQQADKEDPKSFYKDLTDFQRKAKIY